MERGGVLLATERGNVRLAIHGMLCMTLPVPPAMEPGYAVVVMDLGCVMLAMGWGEEPAGNVMELGEWEHVPAAAERKQLIAPSAVELV